MELQSLAVVFQPMTMVPTSDEDPPVLGDNAPIPAKILQLPSMTLLLLSITCLPPKGFSRVGTVCPGF